MLKLTLILLVQSNICYAQDNLDISSLKLVYDRHGRSATFSGMAILCFDNVKLSTEKIIFTFEKGYNTKIEKITIPSKLKMIKSENGKQNVILADSGIYMLQEEKMTLTGNVMVENKKDTIITDQITYYGKLKNIIQYGK